jgi:hypothetical protein
MEELENSALLHIIGETNIRVPRSPDDGKVENVRGGEEDGKGQVFSPGSLLMTEAGRPLRVKPLL